MATFAYLRCSTSEQTTDNQRLEIEQAGFRPDFVFSETISGSVPSDRRPEFQKLLSKIRDGETLVVSKLDRLGRDSIDVQSTIKRLQERGIKVLVLALGSTDLTSPSGQLLMTMLAAVAQMERSLLIERTQAGLQRAKAEGKKLGRKSKTSDLQKQDILNRLKSGETVSGVARDYKVSRATVIGIRKSMEENSVQQQAY